MSRKESSVFQAASRAKQEGRLVFAYRYVEKLYGSGTSAELPDLANVIQSVESMGWRLDRVLAPEVRALTGDRTAFVLVFRAPVSGHN